MRRPRQKQLPLDSPWPSHDLSQELRVISDLLDQHPTISEMAWQDIARGKKTDVGAEGMSGDRVVRCALLQRIHGFTYEMLAFLLPEGRSFRRFVRMEWDEQIGRSTLQENIKKLKPRTWEAINRLLVGFAGREGIEKGRKVRGDATVVQTNIHHPTDSGLLWDGVRVLTRLMKQITALLPEGGLRFQDHCRRAKKRHFKIVNTGKTQARTRAYRDLLKVAEWTYRDALGVLAQGRRACPDDPLVQAHLNKRFDQLHAVIEAVVRVIDQTRRRVLHGEKVSATEKLVSIFERHTDVIVKAPRETLFGHKVFMMSGASSLILDVRIERGNPPDAGQTVPLVARQQELYGRVPRQVAFDGGFVSKDNLASLKALGVKDVAFTKKRGLKLHEMVKSAWVFRQLRNFRAGMEGCISTLKRSFRLNRCPWRGMTSFESYVWSGVVAFNLVVLARHLLA